MLLAGRLGLGISLNTTVWNLRYEHEVVCVQINNEEEVGRAKADVILLRLDTCTFGYRMYRLLSTRTKKVYHVLCSGENIPKWSWSAIPFKKLTIMKNICLRALVHTHEARDNCFSSSPYQPRSRIKKRSLLSHQPRQGASWQTSPAVSRPCYLQSGPAFQRGRAQR